MKKVAFMIMAASFSSLVAAASNDIVKKPGDPIKGQPSPQQTTFTLSKGYFSLFNILPAAAVTPKTDTVKTKQVAAPMLPKDLPLKKQAI